MKYHILVNVLIRWIGHITGSSRFWATGWNDNFCYQSHYPEPLETEFDVDIDDTPFEVMSRGCSEAVMEVFGGSLIRVVRRLSDCNWSGIRQRWSNTCKS